MSRLGLLLLLVFAGVGMTVPLRRWVLEPIYVASGSMEPALPVGSRRVSDKLTLRVRPPRRGDIVLFPSPTGEVLSVGKRVIAISGETLELRSGRVFIDGEELSEPYAIHRRPRRAQTTLGPVRVPPGSVFVLGDNRDASFDSADWNGAGGRPPRFVPVSSITGIVRPASDLTGLKRAAHFLLAPAQIR